jgi:PAS domain S-box-containing protein
MGERATTMPEYLLLVEDDASDALLLQSMLEDHHPRQFATVSVETLNEAKAVVWEHSFDAVLLDLLLPDSHGLETIRELAAAAPNLPIVVLTGVADEAVAREAVHCGAQDYLVKGRADAATIAQAIHYAIDRKRAEEALRAERREVEAKNKELQASQRRLEAYRDRYVDLYDFAPLGYVTLDEDGYVQEINLAGAQLLGADRNVLTGYPFSNHVAKEHLPLFLDHLRKCVDGHCEMTSEVRLTARDGRLISVQLHSIPIKGSAEDVTLCKTAITDITQRKEMEEAIRRSQMFLQTVIDAIPETMLVIGRDYRILLANRAARQMTEGADPAARLTCHQLSHHRDLPCLGQNEPCPLRQVMETKVPATVMHAHYGARGEKTFVEISAAPVFNEAGEVTHIVEACRDVTERKRAEDALEHERNLLRTLIDNLPDYIYIKDAQGRFIAANLATARLMGASTPKDLLGKTDSDFYPPELATEYRADEEDVLRSGRPLINKDEPHVDPTGTRRAVLSTKVPLKDSQGNVVGLVGISRDITERKRMEERLARLNSLKEQLLGPSDLGKKLKLITDAVVKVFGADFARIWLLDEGDLCERGCRHAAVTEGPDVCRDRTHCLHLVASSGRYTALDGGHRRVPVGCYKIGRIASGEEPTFVTNEVTHDPRVHDRQWAASLGLVSFAGYRLLSPKGTPLGVLATFSKRQIDADEDTLLEVVANTANQVIQTGKAEESLERTAEELARSNKDLEQFSSVVSHDLQEPLRTVRGFVQLLRQQYGNRLDADADQYIGHAIDGTNRMETLIGDLLAYARVTTRSGELVPTDAGVALRRALDNLQTSIEETAAEITHGELPFVRANGTQLVQLFQNLIGNALKFRGAAPPTIRIDACRKENHWQFSVCDNGIGIDAKYQDRLSQIFQRLHTRTQYPGTGIGLAICKRIVDHHGGRIWVESEPGQGATFRFTLPT